MNESCTSNNCKCTTRFIHIHHKEQDPFENLGYIHKLILNIIGILFLIGLGIAAVYIWWKLFGITFSN